MQTYVADLSNITVQDNVSQAIKVGDSILTFEFSWDTIARQEYLDLLRSLSNLADGDPLYNTETKLYVRDYDYLSYYLSIPSDIITWLDSNPMLPNSMTGMDSLQIEEYIEERRSFCEEVQTLLNQLQDILKWHVTIYLENDVLTTGLLTLGGWYLYQSNFRIRFYTDSDLTRIDYNDLTKVKIMFGVL